jgi:DNA-binding beta-propeller fold protein YncE
MRHRILLLLALFTAPAFAETCGSRLFVSGFFSTVHVFDACTGAYLRDLDTRARLAGAMAVRLGPDGLLYVVAETTGVVHKYRNDTLEYVGAFAQVPGIGATGLAFDAAGIAYVAGYNSQDVKRFDRAGAPLGPAFPALSSGLHGPDNGMRFGSDGNLYIPSFDNHSVVRWDPRTGATSVAVASRTAGLLRTRGLLDARDGQHMFVTSEGSGTVLKWNLASGAVSVLASGLAGPTGIDYGLDGKLLVSNANAVVRIDPDTGERLGVFVPDGTGGISAQVFLAVIPKQLRAVDTTQLGTQYWLVGDARFNGRVLELPQVFSATGAEFGPGLRFSDLAVKRWGSVRLEFTDCDHATFTWTSSGADSASFGDGGYPLQRIFDNESTARCRAQGVDAADKSWVNGNWYGGESHSGEGVLLHRRADGTTFFAWFTYHPLPGNNADLTQVGSQYWVAGDAPLVGRRLTLPLLSAGGTHFGPTMTFSELTLKTWGQITIEFTSCTTATFSYASTGPGTANFGDGGYPLQRYFDDEASARCLAQGVDAPDKSWVSGQWWGGDAHAGEGLFLDRRGDGRVFVAWFTHRPR